MLLVAAAVCGVLTYLSLVFAYLAAGFVLASVLSAAVQDTTQRRGPDD